MEGANKLNENTERLIREAESRRMGMERCPACGVYNDYITNAHCKIVHGMSKKELVERHGKILNGREVYKMNMNKKKELAYEK